MGLGIDCKERIRDYVPSSPPSQLFLSVRRALGLQVTEIPVTRYFLIAQAYSPVARRFELRKKFPKSMHKFRDLNHGQSIVDRITGEYGSKSASIQVKHYFIRLDEESEDVGMKEKDHFKYTYLLPQAEFGCC